VGRRTKSREKSMRALRCKCKPISVVGTLGPCRQLKPIQDFLPTLLCDESREFHPFAMEPLAHCGPATSSIGSMQERHWRAPGSIARSLCAGRRLSRTLVLGSEYKFDSRTCNSYRLQRHLLAFAIAIGAN
jgi:hypothetical protein